MYIVTEPKPSSSAKGWRLARRFARDRNGVAAIEFAMLAIPFMLLVFAILESCISFAAQQVLSNAMDDVARDIRTGQIVAINKVQVEKAICDRIKVMVKTCPNANLEVDLRTYTSFKLAAADTYAISNNEVYIKRNGGLLPRPLKVEPGGSLTINTMRVFYKWPVITDIMRSYMANVGGNKTLLFSTVTWQNEPFDD